MTNTKDEFEGELFLSKKLNLLILPIFSAVLMLLLCGCNINNIDKTQEISTSNIIDNKNTINLHEAIDFKDKNLEKAIRENLKKYDGDFF